jgi:hypothetical protein
MKTMETVSAVRRPSFRSLALQYPLHLAAPLAAIVTWALLSLLVPQ